MEQSGAVAAERVPNVQQLTARRVENGNVALIWGSVTNVAAGNGNNVAAELLQRRGDLLPNRQQRNWGRPHRVSVGDGELSDGAVRGGGIDVLAVGIRRRRTVGDLARALPTGVSVRRVLPKNGAIVGIHRNRLSVTGGDKENIVP